MQPYPDERVWAEGLAHYLNGFGSGPNPQIRRFVESWLGGAPAQNLRREFNALAKRWPVRLRLGTIPKPVALQRVDSRVSKGDPVSYPVEPDGGTVCLERATLGPIHADALFWLWLLIPEPDPRLRRCPECGTYFVDNTRNRSKVRCGSRCTSRMTSRAHRAEGKEREWRRRRRVTVNRRISPRT